MKTYIVGMKFVHYRTGEPAGEHICVVFAANSNEAIAKAWEKFGNDYTYEPWAIEVPPEGYCLTR